MGLSNAITFRSLGGGGEQEGEQNDFPLIRLWGTLGWIAAGSSLSLYYRFQGGEPPPYAACLWLAGAASLVLAAYCLFLPHTPPIPAKATDPLDKRSAVLESLELLRNPSFAVLVTITGLFGIMLAFYFGCENYFLGDIGTEGTDIVFYMTIGQWLELGLMFLVPVSVATLGVKNTMLIGAGAWALRFGLSAIGQPWWLMIGTIGLHGFAFGFFFVPAFMYVDKNASKDIKASAQNLLIFVIYGIGTIIGSVLSGQLRGFFKVEQDGVMMTDWRMVWGVPFLLTLVCMAAFIVLFKETAIKRTLAKGH